MSDELNMRLRKILGAVVSEYLHTGEAVGSRKVTRRQGIDLSPATVRNVMSDLEDLGLLEQPHTSAGRVPTQTGLRFFIDSLLRVRSLTPKEKDLIRTRCGVGELNFDDVMQHTSKMLSEITHYAGIVLAPSPERARLHHVEFVRGAISASSSPPMVTSSTSSSIWKRMCPRFDSRASTTTSTSSSRD
jgi:heat-inducible transcriptional repressor